MKANYFHYLFVLLLATAATYASANSALPPPSFDAAIQAFKSGNYHEARRLFVITEQSNFKTEQLYYNLGVVNYKLGYYPSAKLAFEKLLGSETLNSLAMYNLGLIEIKLKNETQAQYWLQQSLKQKNNGENVQIIAASLLKKLDNRPITLQRSSKKNAFSATNKRQTVIHPSRKSSLSFKSAINTQIGYNDNVTRYKYIRDITNNKSEDNFMEAQIDGNAKIGNHFNFEASFNDLQYFQNSNYNASSLLLGASYRNSFSWLNYTLNTSFQRQSINSEEFQDLSKLGINFHKTIFQKVRYHMGFFHEIISPKKRIYNYLQGTKQLWNNTIELYLNRTVFYFSYQFEQNQRQDFYSDNVMYQSFSPRIHRFELNYTQQFSKKFESLAYAQYEYIYYPSPDVVSNNFKSYRNDIGLEFGLAIYYKFTRNLMANLAFSNMRNFSNLSRYRFENNKYITGLHWQF